MNGRTVRSPIMTEQEMNLSCSTGKESRMRVD